MILKTVIEDSAAGGKVEILCGNADSGIYVDGKEKGNRLIDFELRNGDGEWFSARAELKGNRICVWNEEMVGRPTGVRYCYSNTNKGGLIYNGSGFPMSPFEIEL